MKKQASCLMGFEKSILASFMGGTRGFADPELRKLQSVQLHH